MIVCTGCGHQNEDGDAFCGACGEFLGWSGQRIVDAESASEPEAVVDLTDARQEEEEEEEESTPAMAATATSAQAIEAATGAETPAATLAAGGEDVAPGTGAVLPGQTARRGVPVPPERPPRPPEPGDLICGAEDCGEGNPAGRRFCRRCGYSLVAAATAPEAPAPPLPWWRRLFRRQPAVHAAGHRRRRGRGGHGGTGASVARALRLAVLAAAGLAIVGAMGPWRGSVGDALTGIRRAVAPRFDPVNPQAARATSELPGRAANLAIDPGSDTSWAEGAPGNGEGQILTLTFEQPVALARIGFTSGAPGKDFLAHPRPRDLHIVFSSGGETGQALAVTTKDITLKDKVDFQVFSVDAKDVTKVDIEIRSVYAGQGGDAAAITDIQFFEKS